MSIIEEDIDTKDEPKLKEHAYDGIQEYDNPLPAWWTWMFVLSIVFAVGYFSINLLSGGEFSARVAYDRDVAADLKRQMAGVALKADAKTLLTLSKDPDTLTVGASIFASNCVACHNKDGSGLIGPNMTDDYYLDVQKITDIPDVVTNGRKNGAMPAWGNRLGQNDIIEVSAYIASLRGQNKASVRPHEGQIIAAWSEH